MIDPVPASLSNVTISSSGSVEASDLLKNAVLLTALDQLPALVFIKDAETREYVYGNEAAIRLSGLTKEHALARTDADLFPEMAEGYKERETALLDDGYANSYESDFRTADGSVLRLRTQRRMIEVPGSPRRYILGLSEDVTETRHAQAEVTRLALYDGLTGLRNRHSLKYASKNW